MRIMRWSDYAQVSVDASISEAAEGKATLHNDPEAFVALLKHRRTPMFKIRDFFEGFLG